MLKPPTPKSGITQSKSEQSRLVKSSASTKDSSYNGSPILTPQEALAHYHEELTTFEKTEINHFPEILTIGSVRRLNSQELADFEGYYKPLIGEQIGYRYQVLEIIDKGSFGQVVKAIDYKNKGREVALKISRNKKHDFTNAKMEIKIL